MLLLALSAGTSTKLLCSLYLILRLSSAGLLFALEGRPATDNDVPCTSKPCEWNRPSKRKKDHKPLKETSFKKIKYSGGKDCTVQCRFRNSLCPKLGNKSRAAIFDMLPPCTENNIDVHSDLNVAQFEEIETSGHIQHISDKFIYLENTVNDENMSQSQFLSFVSTCNQEIFEEIENSTKGQHTL
jgi:hypothetical protein